MQHINRTKEPPQRDWQMLKHLKFLSDGAAKITATCNQMNTPCEQLRSKKGPHCAFSLTRCRPKVTHAGNNPI